MWFCEDILHSALILCDKMIQYLGENYLFSPEESAVPVIEVHFLSVAFRLMGNPQLLRIGLDPDVDKTEGEDESNGEGGD